MKIESTFKNQEFEKELKKLIKENDNEIFSCEYENKKVWVKKARATFSSKLHNFYYKLFPFEILLPVQNKSSKETVIFETNKLIKFKKLGIPTPTVIGRNEDFFVIEDCGKNVNSYIRKRDIKKDKMYYFIDKLIIELANIHNKGEFHGGAQARNFTYKDGIIYIIDLEDSFLSDVDIKLLQFRDLVLFLLSLTKTRASYELDFKYIINKYIDLSKNNDFIKRLNVMASKISFLIYLSEMNFINKLLGRDVKIFFKFFRILKELR